MKLQSWKNRPCPATTAARNRIGAILPCRRQPSAIRDLSSLLLPDEALVMFFPKLLDAPGRPARQQKRADGNQKQQRHTDDHARLLHRNGSSSGCASLSIRLDRTGNVNSVPMIALDTRSFKPTLFISKSRRKPRNHTIAPGLGTTHGTIRPATR